MKQGNELRHIRKACSLTPTQAARMIGIHVNALYRLELGHVRSPHGYTAKRLAGLYGIEVAHVWAICERGRVKR